MNEGGVIRSDYVHAQFVVAFCYHWHVPRRNVLSRFR